MKRKTTRPKKLNIEAPLGIFPTGTPEQLILQKACRLILENAGVWLTPDQIERRLDQGGFDFAPGEPYTGKRAKLEKLRRPQRLEAAMKIDPGLARSGDLWGMLDWAK